ncbi:MAG: DUF359 domain-containing protein [Candidatus Korarchaeota archaeon]|nr:DUF359 domain-containing protein [Candidatus Korarchaeota archaeon]
MTSKRFLSDDGKVLLRDVVLREDMREKIAEAKGKIVRERDEIPHGLIITVGDRVTRTLIKWGIRPSLVVIDLKEKRKVDCSIIHDLNGYFLITTRNPPSLITKESWKSIDLALKLASIDMKVAVVVKGEEDLLGFPVAILSQPGSLMLYGQPDVGMILVEVNEEVRESAKKLLLEAFNPV